MPELPEVETIARDLRARIVGRKIEALELSGKPLRMLQPLDRVELERALLSGGFARVRRRGKYLILEVTTGFALVVHLGMSGRLGLSPADAPRPLHTHVVMVLDGDEELRFVDPRRFGWVVAHPISELDRSSELSALGPDPLEASFTVEQFERALASTRGCSIKAFLLDQRRVAGVGNIYASEALFVAGIHPKKAANRVRGASARRLHSAVQEVLQSAVENRGTTFRDYVDAAGASGGNQFALQVFMRHGKPCPRCRARLRRLVQQARSTFYCAKCQR